MKNLLLRIFRPRVWRRRRENMRELREYIERNDRAFLAAYKEALTKQ